MADAFVFPGGKVDATDLSPEHAAIRELFEEAGVLLARVAPRGAARGPSALDPRLVDEWRGRLAAGEGGESFDDLCRAEGLEPDTAALAFWSRWVTPSAEPRRFDAMFYVAEL